MLDDFLELSLFGSGESGLIVVLDLARIIHEFGQIFSVSPMQFHLIKESINI